MWSKQNAATCATANSRLASPSSHHFLTPPLPHVLRLPLLPQALLIMYFLNTAVSIMLANAYFPQIRASLDEAGSVSTWLLLGIYSDLTPHWYTDVSVCG